MYAYCLYLLIMLKLNSLLSFNVKKKKKIVRNNPVLKPNNMIYLGQYCAKIVWSLFGARTVKHELIPTWKEFVSL